MKIEFVNPFLNSAASVLEEIANLKTKRGTLRIKHENESFRDVCATLGIIGTLRGQVVYGFDELTAKKLVSKMMMGAEVNEFDEMTMSALGELSNIITGKASMALESAGYAIDITPPALIIAKNLRISSIKIPMIIIPLESDIGIIDIYVGLEESSR